MWIYISWSQVTGVAAFLLLVGLACVVLIWLELIGIRHDRKQRGNNHAWRDPALKRERR